MGDHMKKSSVQARPSIELEELYQGIPDESVNLTFQDLVKVNQNNNASSDKQGNPKIEPISNPTNTKPTSTLPSRSPSPPLSKMPSLDFNTGLLQVSNIHHQNHHDNLGYDDDYFSHASGTQQSPRYRGSGEYSMGYEDAMSGVNLATGKGGGRRRRPGIPHSKICTICNTYIYLFRTRCLVCGRVYCRQCLEIGMGEMTEGRKCIQCLGLRFSQRYIERAGKLGCCSWRYPSTVRQTELKWAEKGPRRSGDRGYGHTHTGMMTSSSRPRSPLTPRSPHSIASNEPSFVMSSSYSPFSPHHHLPL